MKAMVIDRNRNRILSIQDYYDKIRPYLKHINDLKKCDTWRIQLMIAINFV